MQSIYHLTDEQIKNLTMKEFYIKQNNIAKVAALYNPYIGGDDKGSKKETPRVATYENMLPFIKKKKA